MDLEGLKVVVGGDLEDGFGTPWIPEADVAVDGRRDDLAVDAPLSVHVHHPTLVLAQRHHSVGKERQDNDILLNLRSCCC